MGGRDTKFTVPRSSSRAPASAAANCVEPAWTRETNDGGFMTAHCYCGWQSSARRARTLARRELDAHQLDCAVLAEAQAAWVAEMQAAKARPRRGLVHMFRRAASHS